MGEPAVNRMAVTGHICTKCGEAIEAAQETYLATVCYVVHTQLDRAAVVGEGLEEFDVLTDDGTELAYEPLFFCLGCWDEISSDLNEIVEDEPPVETEDDVLRCSFCQSGILQFEHFCRIQLGELHLKPQMPHRELNYRFTRTCFTTANTPAMCLSCMTYVTEQILEIWEDVTQDGECADCAHARCWRDEHCSIECECHE